MANTNEEIIVESLTECRRHFNIKGNNSIIDCLKKDKVYRRNYRLTYL